MSCPSEMESTIAVVGVVIPCLNEVESIAGTVREAVEGLAMAGIRGEVVVADNGSTDGSIAAARGAGATVVIAEHRGYGNALMEGIGATSAPYILMGDADGSYDFRLLPRFLTELRSGADLVVGCRFPSGGGSIESGAMPWVHQWMGNPAFSWLARCLFGVRLRDVHCGLRAMSRRFFERAGLRQPGMEFATEMIIKAAQMRITIAEVPIVLRRDTRVRRGSHLRTFRDGLRHLSLFVRMFRLGMASFPESLSRSSFVNRCPRPKA